VYWGFVTDSVAHPLVGVSVNAERFIGDYAFGAVTSTHTGSDGRYRLPLEILMSGAPSPGWELQLYAFRIPDYQRPARDTVPLPGPVTAPLDSLRVDFVLRPCSALPCPVLYLSP
jgi:hypothetical protein